MVVKMMVLFACNCSMITWAEMANSNGCMMLHGGRLTGLVTKKKGDAPTGVGFG